MPSLVQQNTTSAGTGVSSFTINMTSAPTSGNTMTLLVSTEENAGSTIPSVSTVSSTNTTWTSDGSATNGATAASHIELWHGHVSGTGGTAISITMTASATGAMQGSCVEWSGIKATSPLDGSVVGNTGTVATASTGSYSASVSGDLIIVACTNATTITSSPGAPYSSLTSVNLMRSSFIASASSGAQTTANFTTGTPHKWATLIVGYKAATVVNTDPPFTISQPTSDNFPQIVCV